MCVESSFEGEHINLNSEAIVDACEWSGPKIMTCIDQLTGAFVAAMWDTLKSHSNYAAISTMPEIQFFRHLRNACGHDGKWNFTVLNHPAVWRDKELKQEHSGSKVFGGMLKHGDVVLLVIDIDRKYFNSPAVC